MEFLGITPPAQEEEMRNETVQLFDSVQSNPPSIFLLPRIPKVPQKLPVSFSEPVQAQQSKIIDLTDDTRAAYEDTNNKEEIQKLIQEREKYSTQLLSLKVLLDKTLKKEADLLRNRPQRIKSRDPQIIENQKLMQDVKKRIETIHDKHAEVSKKISKLQVVNQSVETPANDIVEDKTIVPTTAIISPKEVDDNDNDIPESNFDYFDAGNHWCTECDEIISRIKTYCDHLHSKEHWKKMDSKNEPWKPENQKPKLESSSDRVTTAMKGSQFLVPVKGFYCTLCSTFMGNADHAEEHLTTARHNRAFMKFTLLNPQYEHKWNADMEKVLPRKHYEEKKRQREEKEERKRNKLKRREEKENKRKERAERHKQKKEKRKAKRDEDREEKYLYKGFAKDSKESSREQESDRRSRDSSPMSCRDSSPEVPKNDQKLEMSTIVCISYRDYRRAYKAQLNAILKQNKKQKVDENSDSKLTMVTTITPALDNEEREIDTKDVMTSINEKCNDFDTTKGENYGLDNDVSEEIQEGYHNSPSNSDDINFDVESAPTKNISAPFMAECRKSRLIVMKQIIFDDDEDFGHAE